MGREFLVLVFVIKERVVLFFEMEDRRRVVLGEKMVSLVLDMVGL